MKSQLARKVRDQFKRRMAEELPPFVAIAADTPGDACYKWRARSELAVFVELCISTKDDAFTVEVGWSTDGEFPGSLSQFAAWLYDDPARGIKKSSEHEGGLRFRVGQLFRPPKDYWWDVVRGEAGEFNWRPPRPPPSHEKIEGCIQDAVRLVKEQALPYVAGRTGTEGASGFEVMS